MLISNPKLMDYKFTFQDFQIETKAVFSFGCSEEKLRIVKNETVRHEKKATNSSQKIRKLFMLWFLCSFGFEFFTTYEK